MAAPKTALDELSAGAFVRSPSSFLGRLGSPAFPAEPGRYTLYVSLACPWACRVLAALALKGLEAAFTIVHVCPTWAPTAPGLDEHRGWVFRSLAAAGSADAALHEVPLVDPLFGAPTLRAVYEACALPEGAARPSKFTVPLLIDARTRAVVCNESSLLLRDIGGPAFNAHARFPGVDLCPAGLRGEIEAVSEGMYEAVNNGVYKCGFAASQAAYDAAAGALAAALDGLAARLSAPGCGGYLCGGVLTEADVRLFVTLVRFDPVYVAHFKTCFRSVRAEPALLAFLRRVHAAVGGAGGCSVGAASVRLDHIKQHYFGSHPKLNPHGIVPMAHKDEGVELLLHPGAPP